MPKFYRLSLIIGASALVMLYQNCGRPKNVVSGNTDQSSLSASAAPDMWAKDTANIMQAQNAADFGSSTPNITMYPTVGSFYMTELTTPQEVPYYEFYGVIKDPSSVIVSCRLDPAPENEFKISVRCPGSIGDVAACDALVLNQVLSIKSPPAGVTISLTMGTDHVATDGTLAIQSFVAKPPVPSNFYFDTGIYEVTLKNVKFSTYTPGKLPANLLNYNGKHMGQSLIDSAIKSKIPGCL